MTSGTWRTICARAIAAGVMLAVVAFVAPATAGTNKVDIARLGSGFVIAWPERSAFASNVNIAAQRLSAKGAALGGQILVSSDIENPSPAPAVATLTDGTFVVVWASRHDYPNGAVYGQRFAANGTGLG